MSAGFRISRELDPHPTRAARRLFIAAHYRACIRSAHALPEGEALALLACLLLMMVTAACSSPAPAPQSNPTLFEGARLIIGDESAPIESSAFLVENNRFTQVGR